MDKMEGRRMRDSHFREALMHFLFDGTRMRKDVIMPLLRQLQGLKAAVEQLPNHRFYSCSLLVVYDADDRCACFDDGQGRLHGHGDLPNKDTGESLVANSSDGSQSDSYDENHPTPMEDVTLVNGACSCSSPRSMSRNIAFDLDQGHEVNSADSSSARCRCANSNAGACLGEQCRFQKLKKKQGVPPAILAESGSMRSAHNCSCVKADARLVDFAHSTYAGFIEDKVIHPGSDHGCLKGLQSLINILTDVLHRDDDAAPLEHSYLPADSQPALQPGCLTRPR